MSAPGCMSAPASLLRYQSPPAPPPPKSPLPPKSPTSGPPKPPPPLSPGSPPPDPPQPPPNTGGMMITPPPMFPNPERSTGRRLSSWYPHRGFLQSVISLLQPSCQAEGDCSSTERRLRVLRPHFGQ